MATVTVRWKLDRDDDDQLFATALVYDRDGNYIDSGSAHNPATVCGWLQRHYPDRHFLPGVIRTERTAIERFAKAIKA